MRKEVVMERLRKKLKDRQANPGSDAASKRAKKQLRLRLVQAQNATSSWAPRSLLSHYCYDDAMVSKISS